MTPYDLTGKAVEKLLDSVNITCNKNTIPNDPKSPFVTSGIRIGTPAVTSRGLKEEDMDQIAEAIAIMIKEGEAAAEKAKVIVKSLTEKYPMKYNDKASGCIRMQLKTRRDTVFWMTERKQGTNSETTNCAV